MESSLSIYSHEKVTNKDIVITYTPSNLVENYEYIIIKDSKELETIIASDNHPSDIILSDTGTYRIKIIEYFNGSSRKIVTGKYCIDKESPVLEIQNKGLTIKKGEYIDIMNSVKATDNYDGDITSLVTTNKNELNLNKVGSNKLIYKVSDTAGNEVSESIMINVVRNDNYQLYFTQGFILIVSVLFFLYMIRYNKSLKIERRLGKYSVKSIKDKNKTLFDGLKKFGEKLLHKIAKILDKSVFIKKYGKRYQKYVDTFGRENDTIVNFVAQKVLMSIIFLIVSIVSKAIRSQILYGYEMVVPLLFGYYFLDIIYGYRYRIYRKKVENDFLQAIIIMNNAFKSGRSITQAVELVSTELDGPIAEEFKKMALEISFGLDIEVVFNRLSDRVNLEEAVYLTSSLSITNKTGGNITKVFDSIEKNLFNRRKLKIELKSLTGSSKIIMYVLIMVPIFFVGIISLINPGYFSPLFTSPIGLILILLMFIIYISYIIIVRKIINIRM